MVVMNPFPDIDRLKARLDPHRLLRTATIMGKRASPGRISVRWAGPVRSSRLFERLEVLAGRTRASQAVPSQHERLAGATVLRRRPLSLAICEIFHKWDCNVHGLCKTLINRPATPLEEAHQGGCFIFRGGCA